MFYFKSYDTNEKIPINSCPFCGGKPKAIHIGNNYKKKKSIILKCIQCRCQRTDATLNYDFAWLEKIATENWNQRP